MQATAKILMTEFVTHDVKRFILERPAGYAFAPGQATEVSINQEGWQKKKRPFTFTSLDEDLVLEFVIKGYFDHDGVTKKLHSLAAGDELILRDVWGTIQYKGPGVFLAGGAGITPFIAILRRLQRDGQLEGNRLIFANKTEKDIILHQELAHMLGDRLVLTLDAQQTERYHRGRVDEDLLTRHVSDFSQSFYLCGPDPMVEALKAILAELGAKPDAVVFEAPA